MGVERSQGTSTPPFPRSVHVWRETIGPRDLGCKRSSELGKTGAKGGVLLELVGVNLKFTGEGEGWGCPKLRPYTFKWDVIPLVAGYV